ncbi:hypothetical protein LR066_02135 [candidate division WOR-3 bacterium]|nr:hypothetical protein [candidate division WOR-3 bacterium]
MTFIRSGLALIFSLSLLFPFLYAEPNNGELLFVEIRLGRFILADHFDLLEQNGRVYAPLGWLSRGLRIAITAYPEKGIAKGFVIEEAHGFHLDAGRATVVSGEETFSIPDAAIIILRDDIYVDIRLLEKWLPLKLDYSRRDLSLSVLPTRPLPIQMQMERSRKHKRFLKKEAVRGRLALIPLRPIITPTTWLDGFALDYTTSFHYSSPTPAPRGFYTMITAFELAHGDLQMALSGNTEKWLRSPAFISWVHRRPEDILIREFYLGYISPPPIPLITGSGQNLGLLLSNYPLGLPDSPFQHTFEGSLLPGWTIELYRNEELITFAYGDETGRFTFENIPLPFGSHTFKKIFYGPLGERRTEIQHFYLPRLLAPGEVRYKAGAVRSPWGAADDYSEIFALSEVGISRWLSLSASALNIHNYPAKFHRPGLSSDYLSVGGTIWLDNLILRPVIALDIRQGGKAVGLRGDYRHPLASFYIDGHHQEEFISPATPFVGQDPLRSRIEGGVHARIWKGASGRLSIKEERFGHGLLEIRRRSVDARLFTRYRRIGFSPSLHHWENERGGV